MSRQYGGAEWLRREIAGQLERIRALLPVDYRNAYILTFVARHPDNDEAHIIVTEEPDME